MKILLLLALIGPSASAGETRGADKTIDCAKTWKNIKDLATTYEEKKDKAAGKKLWESLPTGRRIFPTDCPEHGVTNEYLYTGRKYLNEQLQKGDDLAFQITFRMINVSDGAFSEDLHIDLGKTIQKYPKKFLKYLRAENNDTYCPGSLLKNTGEYDQDPKVDAAEFKKRTKALESVKDKNLAKIKASCLKEFKIERD